MPSRHRTAPQPVARGTVLPFKGNKRDLPSKPCSACGRQMTWRARWAKNWDLVKFCSDACRKRALAGRRGDASPEASRPRMVRVLPPFPPTRTEALARIAATDPAAYARSRNAIDGGVTRLSPYITHGFVTLPEVLAGATRGQPPDTGHKLAFELGWREFFRHVWRHEGARILDSMHAGPLPDEAYARELPQDIRHACTGIPAIDQAVRTLYATGYLHNHARMWLASYVVHLRRVHWRTGADWLYGHLLDGDLASNHLSWQWIAGTASRKPYVFNADNVARYAPLEWHSPGTAVDASYEEIEAIARGGRLPAVRAHGEAIDEPPLRHGPRDAIRFSAPEASLVAGRDVWLVHPWALGDPPTDLPADTLRIAILDTAFHDEWAWSDARWAFVGRRMEALASLRWRGDAVTLARGLRGARSVHAQADEHVASALATLAAKARPAPRIFREIDEPCASFSRWWKLAAQGLEGWQVPTGSAACNTEGASS